MARTFLAGLGVLGPATPMRHLAEILFVGLLGVTARAAEPCLHFEPAPAAIVGTLVRRTFPGPPNYESVNAGDQPETYWLVELRQPLCVVGTPRDDVNGANVSGVTLVQLILVHDEYKSQRHLVGKSVRATGTLTTAVSGHHHTPVLLHVARLTGVK